MALLCSVKVRQAKQSCISRINMHGEWGSLSMIPLMLIASQTPLHIFRIITLWRYLSQQPSKLMHFGPVCTALDFRSCVFLLSHLLAKQNLRIMFDTWWNDIKYDGVLAMMWLLNRLFLGFNSSDRRWKTHLVLIRLQKMGTRFPFIRLFIKINHHMEKCW